MEGHGENGIDDLMAFFEEDNDDLGSDLDMNSDEEIDKLIEEGDNFEAKSDKMLKQEIKASEDTNAVDAIKDENAKLKDQLRLLQLQLAGKDAESKKPVNNNLKQKTKGSGTESIVAEKVKDKCQSQSDVLKESKGSAAMLFKNKQRSAHVGTREPAMERNSIDHVNPKKRKAVVEAKEVKKEIAKADNRPYSTEEYSGIKVINPLISSQTMDTRMEGRSFVKCHAILNHVNKNDVKGDWVTVGVLVTKLPPKTASNGKTFSIWKLSDLTVGSENNTVTLFLFGDVHKEHWKTCEGTVIGLLNATIMSQRDNDQVGNVAITIDDPRKMMIMGTSKDLGRCKGGTKSGKQCSFIVNKSFGDYCEHHVSREYKKIKSHRMEFQAGSGPDPKKGNMMKKFKKDVESGSYSYGGETLTWKDRPDPSKKPNNKKLTLADIAGPGSTEFVKKELADLNLFGESKSNAAVSSDLSNMSDDLKSRLQMPTTGSRNILRLLKKEETEEKENSTSTKSDSKSARDLLNEEKKEMKKKATKQIDMKLPMFKSKPPSNQARRFSADFRPKLARGFDPDDDIEFADFDDLVSDGLGSGRKSGDCDSSLLKNISCRLAGKSGMRSDPKKTELAKRKAVAIVRSKGIRFDNDDEQPKKKSENVQKINERVLRDISAEADNCEPSKKRRKGILEDAFGSLDFESEEGKKLLKTKSVHAGQVRQAEAEREAAYFNALEKKEMFEEKMQSVMEMKVQVVCCKICKYMHEFQSSHCKKQGHPTIRVEAMKRFFSCKNCKHRTIGFKKLPDHPCKSCGANNYERTSMHQEKKGPKLGSETLLVRGEEHSRFLNGLK